MKYRIIVRGEAKTNHPVPAELDGIRINTEFTEYFSEDEKSLFGVVTDGYTHFEKGRNDDKLYAVAEYNSSRALTYEELDALKEYTTGQWSDGIGEGFEQVPCVIDDKYGEIFLSPWYYGQEAIIGMVELATVSTVDNTNTLVITKEDINDQAILLINKCLALNIDEHDVIVDELASVLGENALERLLRFILLKKQGIEITEIKT